MSEVPLYGLYLASAYSDGISNTRTCPPPPRTALGSCGKAYCRPLGFLYEASLFSSFGNTYPLSGEGVSKDPRQVLGRS
jgi:hypothetical protein